MIPQDTPQSNILIFYWLFITFVYGRLPPRTVVTRHKMSLFYLYRSVLQMLALLVIETRGQGDENYPKTLSDRRIIAS